VLRLQRVTCADAAYLRRAHCAAVCPLCLGILQYEDGSAFSEGFEDIGQPMASDQPGSWTRCPSFAIKAVLQVIQASRHVIDTLALHCKARRPIVCACVAPFWPALVEGGR
jgi:hypothetical protein